jgi:hypothetical protein
VVHNENIWVMIIHMWYLVYAHVALEKKYKLFLESFVICFCCVLQIKLGAMMYQSSEL